MSIYNNMKIRFKLIIGFGVVIILTLTMSFIGYVQLNSIDRQYSDMINVTVGQSKAITEAGWNYAKIRRITTAYVMYSGNESKLESLKAEYDNENQKVNAAIRDYKELLLKDKNLTAADIESRRTMSEEALDIINNEYAAVSEKILKKAMQNDAYSAADEVNRGIIQARAADEIINQLIKASVASMGEQHGKANEMAELSKIMLVVIAASASMASIFAALFISGKITAGVTAVTNAAQKISNGDFDIEVGSRHKDEIGALSNMLLKVKETVQYLTNDIKNMSQEFAKGDIEAKIDDSAYKGEFKNIALEINNTFAGAINDTLETLREIREFGNGNFDVDVADMPGKKGIFTQSFKAMQKNLKLFDADIGEIISEATEGNLQISIDAAKYKGDWRKMAEGVNRMLSAVIEPIREVIEALNELSQGNLKISVTGDYQGEFAKMKTALNGTIEMLLLYIEEIGGVLHSMSNQDLTKTISHEYVGDFAAMRTSINMISDSFNVILARINVAAEQVSVGAAQMSDSSVALAQGATEQANYVEELNETMVGIGEQTMKNAQNASRVNELALATKESAEVGSKEMESMLAAMDKINKSSGSISNIIKVIDDIAFQTNLLALNAAVEAARAGSHGKGFAVVADEVRNLAAKSKSAAEETALLIEESVATVAEGLKMAGTTAIAFNKIVHEIGDISEISSEVARASINQSERIGQVNIGINQISNVIQSNSATSEEQAAASEELASQADMFKSVINKFKLAKNNRASQGYAFADKFGG